MAVTLLSTFTPTDTTGVASTAGVATYSGISIGTTAADRIVVLGVVTEATSATINSVTMDVGAGAVAMEAGVAGVLGAQNVRLFYSTGYVPTGTTATFAITYGAAVTGGAGGTNNICVYKVTGAQLEPVYQGAINDTDADPITTTTGVPVVANGGLLVLYNGANDATSRTWSGATVDINADAGACRLSTGTFLGVGAPIVTVSGANGEDATLCYLSFIPTAANFGDLIGGSTNFNASIPASYSPSHHLDISVGDLVVVVVAEITTASSTACNDNLGNAYTPLTSGASGNTVNTVAAFYSLATVAGECTPVVTATASAHDATILATVFKGTFDATPLDKNPVVAGPAASEPYASNATGTLSQADELIIGYFSNGAGATGPYDTPAQTGGSGTPTINIQFGPTMMAAVTSLVVSANTSLTMKISDAAGNANVACGVATFKKSTGVAPSTVTESITTTDAQSAKFGPAKKSLSESITPTDTQTRIRYTRSTAAESFTFTDTTNAIKPLKATAAEALSLTDTHIGKRTTRATAAETLVFTDTQTTKAIFKSAAAESLSLVDTPAARKRTLSTAAETLALTDNQTARQTSRSTAAESLVLVDTATASSGKPPSFVTETLTLTDAQSARRRNLSTAAETLTLSDTQSARQTSRSTASEALTISDSQTARQRTQLFVTETLTLTDQQLATSAHAATASNVSETITIADTQSARTRTLVTGTETISLTDNQTRLRTTKATATESLSLTDTQTGKRFASVSDAETIAPVDTQSTRLNALARTSETIALLDSQTARERTFVNTTETLSLTDATDGSVLAAGISQCPENISPLDQCDSTVIAGARDTHDGFVKKKKKKKKIDEFAEEIDRREKIRKQITEVIHPPVVPVEEPEIKLPEIVEAKPFEIKTKITPAVDYAGLAKEEIVAKLRQEAELKARQEFERQKEETRQLELKRLADIEDEEELEMILEALL